MNTSPSLSTVLLSYLRKARLVRAWNTAERLHKLSYVVSLVSTGLQAPGRGQLFGWVSVHTATLEERIGWRFACPALRALVKAGVLECNAHYSHGRKQSFSRSYRLTESFKADWQQSSEYHPPTPAQDSREYPQQEEGPIFRDSYGVLPETAPVPPSFVHRSHSQPKADSAQRITPPALAHLSSAQRNRMLRPSSPARISSSHR